MLKFFRLTIFVVVLLAVFVSRAHAIDYTDPNWPNLTRTLIRFGAINLENVQMVDEYSIVTECDLYLAFYQDDFKWNKVRIAVRENVKNNLATFPTGYHYDVKLQLDHYDFSRGLFSFTQKSGLRNINTFTMYTVDGTGCGAADVKDLPRSYRVVLAAPLYMDGLPIGESEGHTLLQQMSADHNVERFVYARLNLSVVYIEPLQKLARKSGTQIITRFLQPSEIQPGSVRLDARLDSIDFYEDLGMQHPIYHYQP